VRIRLIFRKNIHERKFYIIIVMKNDFTIHNELQLIDCLIFVLLFYMVEILVFLTILSKNVNVESKF